MKRLRWLLPLAGLATVALLTALAGFFSPYSVSEQQRSMPFAPPMRLHLIDEAGRLHLRPFVYGLTANGDGEPYAQDPSRAYPLRFFVRGSEYRLLGLFRSRVHLFGVNPPGQVFLAGTDGYGRDQFSRLLHGGQISMAAGMLATLLSLGIGLLAGAAAGFRGGIVDDLLMRGSELFFALPWLYLLFAVRAFLPLHVGGGTTFFLVVGVIAAVGWARPARLVRGIVLSAKERNCVVAARGFGASNWYLLHRHVLPETYPVLLTQAALLAPQYMLAEVTLSFLGLGVGEPLASWGSMLGSVSHYHVLTAYWWMLAPVALLVPIFVACHTLADLLQEQLEPGS
jgi:peptide/nickel transport system permease protein